MNNVYSLFRIVQNLCPNHKRMTVWLVSSIWKFNTYLTYNVSAWYINAQWHTKSIFSKSIVDMTTHIAFWGLCVALGVVANKMNVMEPCEINLPSNHWYPYTLHLIGPIIGSLGFVFLSYGRNNSLRASFVRELKEKTSGCFRCRNYQLEDEA